MRVVTKGVNYTEVRSHKKGDFLETVQVWILQKPRKESECGIWVDGIKQNIKIRCDGCGQKYDVNSVGTTGSNLCPKCVRKQAGKF